MTYFNRVNARISSRANDSEISYDVNVTALFYNVNGNCMTLHNDDDADITCVFVDCFVGPLGLYNKHYAVLRSY